MHKRECKLIKSTALSEIFILVLATVAFSVIVSSVNAVSGQGISTNPTNAPTKALTTWTAISKTEGYGYKAGDPITYIKNPTTGKLQFINKETGALVDSKYGTVEEAQKAGEITVDGGGMGPRAYLFGTAQGPGQNLVQGVVWGLIAYGAGQAIGSMFGMEEKQTKALSTALAAGFFAGKAIMATGAGTGWAWGGGIGIAAIVFLAMYKKEKTKTVSFSCLPWEPPIGGAKCEQCNKDPFRPCSEYRCRALGQACQLLNKDKPGEELCAAINPKDVTSPTIAPWVSILSPQGLRYIEDTSIRPPALGVKIVRTAASNGCLAAFTPLVFGITTNEPAQCKIDYNHTMKFDDMQLYFGGTNSNAYNHTQRMKLPGPDALNESAIIAGGGSPILKNDGTMQLFVRCRDANNNSNVDEYSIKFCVDPSPDTTPPFIEGTSITSGSPVQFGSDKVPVEFYVNEPAQCKWSIDSKSDYGNMGNNMSCATSPGEINARLSYTCATNLTGIKNKEENKFYVRCKDKPDKPDNERNVMVQSYEYILKGSQQLNIIKVSPNGTVTGSTTAVAVDLELETGDGSNEGQAFCYFSGTGANDSFVAMYETNSFKHKQTLQLTAGDYTYYFRCTDLGGNSAYANTLFTVYSDKEAPNVARIYKEEGVGLKVVTNENAECVYSLTSCDFVFTDGLKLLYSNPSIRTNSYAEWKASTIYYIKCRDDFGNEPNPNECSVIARPVDLVSKK
jgi:hypothetical protein